MKLYENCDTLRDSVPLVQSKEHEKHPWRSVTLSKVASFELKYHSYMGVFQLFLNCTNGT